MTFDPIDQGVLQGQLAELGSAGTIFSSYLVMLGSGDAKWNACFTALGMLSVTRFCPSSYLTSTWNCWERSSSDLECNALVCWGPSVLSLLSILGDWMGPGALPGGGWNLHEVKQTEIKFGQDNLEKTEPNFWIWFRNAQCRIAGTSSWWSEWGCTPCEVACLQIGILYEFGILYESTLDSRVAAVAKGAAFAQLWLVHKL